MGARRNHAYYIDRYPVGLDATIWLNGNYVQTMSFTNDSEYPILIRGINRSNSVTFEIYGVPDGRTVDLSKARVWAPKEAWTRIEYTTDLPPGASERVEYPFDGFQSSVSRTVRSRHRGTPPRGHLAVELPARDRPHPRRLAAGRPAAGHDRGEPAAAGRVAPFPGRQAVIAPSAGWLRTGFEYWDGWQSRELRRACLEHLLVGPTVTEVTTMPALSNTLVRRPAPGAGRFRPRRRSALVAATLAIGPVSADTGRTS